MVALFVPLLGVGWSVSVDAPGAADTFASSPASAKSALHFLLGVPVSREMRRRWSR